MYGSRLGDMAVPSRTAPERAAMAACLITPSGEAGKQDPSQCLPDWPVRGNGHWPAMASFFRLHANN